MPRKKISFAGKNLRYARRDHGLSQEEFAEKFLIERHNLAKYETGKAEPDQVLVQSVCEHWEYNIDDFYHKAIEDELDKDFRIKTLQQIDDKIEQLMTGEKGGPVAADEGDGPGYQPRRANPKIQFEVDYLIRRVVELQKQIDLLRHSVADKEKIIVLQEDRLATLGENTKSKAS